MRNLSLGFAILFLAGIAWAADNATSTPDATFVGKVLEVKDVDSYTYLRLKTKDGETWAAVNRSSVKIGSDVAIGNATVMDNFESKTLNKKFDRIVFGTLVTADASPVAAPGGNMAAMHAGMAKPVEIKSIKVAKATGPDARTVAEIIAKRADLKGKAVVVRGQVVKFTPGVMGKNWVHLRDGSGTSAAGTDDVVVTTLDETKIGDVVLVRGVVATDRDLGSGYTYKVLIEEAKLSK